VTAGAQTADNPTPGQTGGTTLAGAAEMLWPTPDTPSGGRTLPPGTSITGQTPDGRKVTVGLENATALWPTPSAAQDTKGAQADEDAVLSRQGKHQLAPADVSLIFSRPAPETATHGRPYSDPRLTWRRLRRLVISTHGRATWKRMAANGGKRRLNPNFVGWLMHWQTGHALCACSAMASFRYVLASRGALSRLPTACGPWIWQPPPQAPPMMQGELWTQERTE
jgi:hypothetical protein